MKDVVRSDGLLIQILDIVLPFTRCSKIHRNQVHEVVGCDGKEGNIDRDSEC